MNLAWFKCDGDNWCSFARLNLDHELVKVGGVYVIWHSGPTPATVYVGQSGNISERLGAHRNDKNIIVHYPLGLFVTWARVDAKFRDGIERYLIDALRPIGNDRGPSATPISVGSPWA